MNSVDDDNENALMNNVEDDNENALMNNVENDNEYALMSKMIMKMLLTEIVKMNNGL